MALQLNHFNGATVMSTLQTSVSHTPSSFPSSSTASTRTSTGPSFAGMTTNACSRLSSLLSTTTSRVSTHSREKQRGSSRLLSRTSTSVQCAASTATDVELSAEKLGTGKELPPLQETLEVEGLPPCQRSMYEEEALAYILSMGPTDMFEPLYIVCTSFSSFVHCGAVSAERLGVIAGLTTLITIMDDILFDDQDGDALEKLGIDRTILASPAKIMEYIRSMDALMRQEKELPIPTTPIDDMVWKLGRDLRAISPSHDWFNLCVDAVLDFYTSNFDHYCSNLGATDGKSRPLPDLATYTAIRFRTAGGRMAPCAVQFCQNSYLSPEIRDHPVVQRLTGLAFKYTGYIQDIFSYSKELINEGSTTSLLHVLMAGDEDRDTALPRAAWQAVNLTRAVVQEFMEVEATQLPSTWQEGDPGESDVRLYVEGLKEVMSGFLYWHLKTKRYRHPDAHFPELRNVNISYLPEADFVKKICL